MSEQIYNKIEQLLYLAIENEISKEQILTLNTMLVNHPDRIRFAVSYLQVSSFLKQSNKVANMTQDQLADEDLSLDSIEASITGSEVGSSSNVSLRGVDLAEFDLDAELDDSRDPGLPQKIVELLELERTSPAIEIPKEEPKRELIQKVESNFKWFPGRPSKFKNRTLLAMVASIMVFIGYAHFFAPDPVDRPVVAKLDDSISAVWNNEFQMPDEFGFMVQSRYGLKKGYATILLNDGVSVTVEAPAELSLNSGGDMELIQGRIYAIVPERAHGFTVKAGGSKIVDLGTEFGVEVDSNNNTQLHVTKGKTMLFAGLLNGIKKQLEVTKGSAKKIYSDGFVKDIELSENKFVQYIESKTGLVYRKGPELVIYEPFDYSVGELEGKGVTSEIGLDGLWSAVKSPVTSDSLAYDKISVKGGSVIGVQASNFLGGSRSISKSALVENGLLDDGATLWFSLVAGYSIDANLRNSSLAFALANSKFNLRDDGFAGNKDFSIVNKGTQVGSGIGLVFGTSNKGTCDFRAAKFRDSLSGKPVYGENPDNYTGVLLRHGQIGFIVGKITWGTDSDTIELYKPDADFNLGSPVSTLTTSVDQSAFDTLTFSTCSSVAIDEIRFGKTYPSVLGQR